MKLKGISLSILLLALLSISIYFKIESYYYSEATKTMLQKASKTFNEKNSIFINDYVKNIDNIFLALEENYHFKEFITHNKNKEISQQLFLSAIKQHNNMFKLRYINKDGMELIRVDKTNKKAWISKPEELQNKQHRYYFKEVIKLDKSKDLWYSNLDLNMENKKTVTPYKATLRVAKPIYSNNNTKTGILIASLSLNSFLENLIKNNTFNIFLIDREKNILATNYKNSDWISFLTKKTNMDQIDIDREKTYSKEISLGDNREFTLLLEPKKEALENFYQERNKTMLVLIILVNLTIIFILFLLNTNHYLKQKVKNAVDKEILKSKEEFETIFYSIKDPVAILDLRSNFLEFNDAYPKLLGFTKEELLKKSCYGLTIPEDKEMVKESLKELLEKRYIQNLEKSCIRKDGSIINVNITFSLMPDNKRVIATTKDITLNKEQENIILNEKKSFEAIFYYAQDGIVIFDSDSYIVDCNCALLGMIGYEKDELIGRSVYELTNQKEDAKEKIAQIKKDGHIESYERILIKKDKKELITNLSLSVLPGKDKILAIVKDMTKIKLADQQLRLASMGELIGNIAHQWRQPLSVISTSASGIKFKYDYTGSVDKKFIDFTTNKIIEQTKYLSDTIEDFRNFLKEDKEFKNISVIQMVKGSITLVTASMKNNFVNIILDLEDDLEIYGNKNELQQAVINILNNAKDFIVERKQEDEDKLICISTKKTDDNTLELKILDSAGGIDEKIIHKIFDPYFTTKHKSIGTGLGLSMTDKILRERHNFVITVHNEEFTHNGKNYKGASFIIFFNK